MEENHQNHITPFRTHARVLVALLLLTFLTVTITGVHLGAFTVLVALLIACIKGGIVLTWFMHLKFELPVFRYMILGVLALFLVIIVITFIDYAFR